MAYNMNPTDTICLKESNIIRLIEAYLDFRGFHMTLAAIERETGVLNAQYSENALVLRHQILDGKWREAVKYAKELPLPEADLRYIVFEIMKQKYIELICVYEELGNELYDDLGNAIAVCFSEMSSYCSCPVEYENLRKLASLTNLSQDPNYENWNPFTSRRKCFQTVYSVLLELSGHKEEENLMEPNRLTDLLVKGILYESVEEYCRQKVNAPTGKVPFHFGSLARNPENFGSNLGLYSWIQCVPWVSLEHPFVRRHLNVHVDNVDNPFLEKKWTEIILQNCADHEKDNTESETRPDSGSQVLKETFWNRRIENRLILDAPEILKRAEAVIDRWEKRNCNREASNSTKDEKKIPSSQCLTGIKCSKEVSSEVKTGKFFENATSIWNSSPNCKTVSSPTHDENFELEIIDDEEKTRNSTNLNCTENADSSKSAEDVSEDISAQKHNKETNEFVSNSSGEKCHPTGTQDSQHHHSNEEDWNTCEYTSTYPNESDGFYDENESVRCLLKAKEELREKLLNILTSNGKGNENLALSGADSDSDYFVE